MTKRASFTAADVARALKGAQAAGVKASILIRPDGTMLILPGGETQVVDAAADLDDRMARFAGA